MSARLQLNARRSHAQLVEWAAHEAWTEPRSYKVARHRGRQATVLTLHPHHGTGVALKVFRTKHPAFRNGVVTEEIAGLHRLNEIVSRFPYASAPSPINVHPTAPAYVMTLVPGRSLVPALPRLGIDDACRLGAQLGEVIEAYHDRFRRALGDFQPRNILVHDAGLSVIDPTHPRMSDEPGNTEGTRAQDLGWFVQACAATLVRSPIRRWQILTYRSLLAPLMSATRTSPDEVADVAHELVTTYVDIRQCVRVIARSEHRIIELLLNRSTTCYGTKGES